MIEAWHRRELPWQAVAKVREALRTTVILNEALPAPIRTAAEQWYGETFSDDAVQRNLWLFDSSWSVKLEGVTERESVRSYQEREKRLLTRRLQAVDVILMSRGTAGVQQLAEDAPSPRDIGYTLAFVENEAFRVVDFVAAVVRRPVGKEVGSALLRTLRGKLAPVLQALRGCLPEDDFATLLLWAPCEPAVWVAAESSSSCTDDYWQNVDSSVAVVYDQQYGGSQP